MGTGEREGARVEIVEGGSGRLEFLKHSELDWERVREDGRVEWESGRGRICSAMK